MTDASDESAGNAIPTRAVRIERSPGRMRAFRIAYDGRPFRGFQRQPDVRTVEDTLFDALRALDVFASEASEPSSSAGPISAKDESLNRSDRPDRPDRPAGYAAAGRTDAGVSALAQTVAFACPDWLTPSALNAELPASIRAWASADVDADFHATHDAARREYTYYLHAPAGGSLARDSAVARDSDRTGTTRTPRIDDETVRIALDRLGGRHDFHNLSADDSGTVRDLTATVDRDGEFLVVRVAAGGFPREFVRRVVTLLRRVGTGDVDLAFVDRVLDPEPLSGGAGIGPAAPEPLVLSGVSYPDCTFERDAEAVASATDVFGARRASALASARVAGHVRDGVEGIEGDTSESH